ncbi:protein kinase domain-containing protein [Nannocystis pusilla]|uniref:serine/threonine-protein kinase n=1 Tax=Nannocystis pusilla TaxID=889268 RepID=UPI003DA44EA3
MTAGFSSSDSRVDPPPRPSPGDSSGATSAGTEREDAIILTADGEAREDPSEVRERPAPARPQGLGDPFEKQLLKRSLLPSRSEPVRIGRFTVVRRIGQGGMGTVYACYDEKLDRKVAVKVLHLGAVRERDTATPRLLREAQAMARMSHPNIVTVLEVGESAGTVYVAMEFVKGKSLETWCEQQPRTWREIVATYVQAGRGLAAAHAAGIIHRDFKPQNVMIGDDGQVKVLDFGLARATGEAVQDTAPADAPAPASTSLLLSLTRTGVRLGTPAYMSPEQYRGETVTSATDQFSFCVSLYRSLYGEFPFPMRSLDELQAAVLGGRVAPPPGDSEVPQRLSRVLLRGLKTDPAQRFGSMAELLAALEHDPLKKYRLAAVATAVAVVSLVVFVGLALRERHLAAQETQLARALGEDIKEMQLFMRYAYALPLHDVERERAVVRGRLAALEDMAREASAPGPVHYALGRGYLSLHEPANALTHLRAAERAGHRSPEVAYAFGRALVELYREEVEKLPRIADEAARAERQARLDAAFKRPALLYLRAAAGSRLEHPAYVEGLIALIEERHADALRLAREAAAAVPWFYEATALEAETLYAIGLAYGHDGADDYPRMMASVGPALVTFRRAAAIGRSDPQLHTWACKVYTQLVHSVLTVRDDLAPDFREGLRACDDALASSPTARSTRQARAHLHLALAERLLRTKGPAARPDMRAALDIAEELIARDPDDAFGHWMVGAGFHTYHWALYKWGFDIDDASVLRGIRSYEAAIRLDPSFIWPARELSWSHHTRAWYDFARGDDPFDDLDRSIEAAERAQRTTRDWRGTFHEVCDAHADRAELGLLSGLDPAADLARGHENCRADIRLRENYSTFDHYVWLLVAELDYHVARGGDLGFLDERVTWLSDQLTRVRTPAIRGQLHRVLARIALARGTAPEPHFTRALAELEESSGRLDLWLARLRSDMARGDVDSGRFDQAVAAAAAPDGMVDPRPRSWLFAHAAAIRERRAAWLASRGADPSADITEGLSLVERALAKNPRTALAVATRGALHLVEAKLARSAEERRAAARRAQESISEALRLDRWLTREYEPALREAHRMLAER